MITQKHTTSHNFRTPLSQLSTPAFTQPKAEASLLDKPATNPVGDTGGNESKVGQRSDEESFEPSSLSATTLPANPKPASKTLIKHARANTDSDGEVEPSQTDDEDRDEDDEPNDSCIRR
ncbi:hypothetical protein GALMADRAFT_137507 [Galerina marginata CBS 339.88]|uniref:Uncharacterized protein n=1 Tax=Galerina marginata (strain CBS 339.88) TaxID=685588 RepID=A0A067TEY5_GALM3|nr:hypothetical protein GALMADRAFT_137507 [Galerina marginata CBS 339.88]